MKNKIVEKLKNKHIAILGFGREGQATYEFIKTHLPSSKITVIDKCDVRSKIPNFDREPNVNVVFGEDYLNNLSQYDLIMKTPGVSFLGMDISSFKDKITSQMELFLEANRDHVIGITGTKGKSTTSSLISHILTVNGFDNILAGNIGVPVFNYVKDEYEDTIFVLEMSSHQLEFLKVSPKIAIVLNLFQDHLDHTGSVEEYYNSKMNIFAHQTPKDYMLYFKDNDNLNRIVNTRPFRGQPVTVSAKDDADIYLKNGNIYSNNEIVFNEEIPRQILGQHNLINIMFAYKVAEILGLDHDKTLNAITSFKGLEYRLECIGEVNGVKYYVDTLATIPEATIQAIESIPNINTLIFGGMDRGISYQGFAEQLTKSHIAHFICMPETGHTIGKELPESRAYFVDTLEEAVELAKQITEPRTVCILSPAAASYKHFKNYQDKAEKYKELVLKRTK